MRLSWRSLAWQVLRGSVVAQTQVNLGAQAASGDVQLSPAEYKAYNDAISQSTPQTKAPALEQYLTAVSTVDLEGVRAGATDAGL